MHGFTEPDAAPVNAVRPGWRWWSTMTRYHWFVLFVAALGWLFDCLDQQLFVLARPAVMESLVQPGKSGKDVTSSRQFWGDISTSVFIAGWATGGLFFGVLGDRIGRARTMVITILMYSVFTGLSALSVSVYDFAFYRFLTGLGVGGEFAVGVALVAEVMPSGARAHALALLQALSGVGNVSAALINLRLGLAEQEGLIDSPWRYMFVIGAVPALLALVVRRNLQEPEAWKAAVADPTSRSKLGSYRELLEDPVWRRHALLGLALGCCGVIGLWSVGFYSFDLVRSIQFPVVKQEVLAGVRMRDAALADRLAAAMDDAKVAAALSAEDAAELLSAQRQIKGGVTYWQSMTSIMQNIGAFLGMFGFGYLSQLIGRRPTFAIAFCMAFLSTFLVFAVIKEFWQLFVLIPLMGFCQLSLFAGFAIYFPELFPTRLRSTGTSFCYNVGRFVAAGGPLIKAGLDAIYRGHPDAQRLTGMTMSTVFLLGLLVLPFLPETRGRDLPE